MMFKRFVAYYKPHLRLFWADMTASMLISLVAVVYPIVTRAMLNDLIPNRRYRMIIFCGVILLGLYGLRMLLRFFVQYKGHIMGVRMQAQMRSDMFEHLQKLPFSFYDGQETGKIMSRMTNDLMDVSELAHHGPENLLISGVSVITAFVYLCTINVWLTLIVFACVPFLFLIAAKLRRRQREAFAASRAAIAEVNGTLQSSIAGIRVTKAFDNAAAESAKFEKGNAAFIEARRKAYHAMGLFHSTTSFVTDVFNVIVLIAGGLFLYRGDIRFGDYSAFIVSVNMFISPMMTLINFVEQYQEGVSGFRRFVEIMDTPAEADLPGAVDAGRLSGHIRFENVTYGYGREQDVLHGLSLDIPRGSTFALVGPSGGGKTTVCHLIPRFYEVEQGRIEIDGTDTKQMTLSSLRRQIGIVQQDIYLFDASVKDNILYGRPGATDEEVVEAARRANIHDDIMKMKDGYDTIIGERGVRLSGGQKQRLSIARVFLKNPPILILDEATSALDTATEMMIQQSLDELCRGRTTLVVAHRLSTVKNADRIAVVSDGRIIEEGSHTELMAQNAVYADLYRRQFGAFEEPTAD